MLSLTDEQAIADSQVVAGKVKLDLRYNETNKKFTIIVQHVQSLVSYIISKEKIA